MASAPITAVVRFMGAQFFRKHLIASEVFGPFDLVRMLEKEEQELGLIIDLTFTTRYYRVEDLPDSLHHLKIFTAGHEVPKDATILSFKKAVRHFLRNNENNDKLIGVHCTHGLNRTGYLICRYLIDVDGMMPQKAIHLFDASRGHCIERQNYLDDLTTGPKRSNEGMDEPEQEPVRGRADETLHQHSGHHDHELPVNTWGPYQWHRDAHTPFSPFQQRNAMSPFGPQFLRPPLFSHPPPGVRPLIPGFPHHSFKGPGPLFPYPPPLPPYIPGEPYSNPYVPAGGSSGPSGPYRRHRHRRDWTPR